MIKSACKNILETSSVILSSGTEDSDFPLYRLYDRDIGRVFKPVSAQTIEILIDQGSEIFTDKFDDNAIDTAKWNETDSGSNINETNQRIEGKGNDSWNWSSNGLVTDNPISLAKDLTWCFTLSPQSSSIASGLFGPSGSSTLINGTQGCQVFLGYNAGDISVYINGAVQPTGYFYQALKTYCFRIVYKSPGWEVYIISPDDTNYSSETLIFSMATYSTGPMYFHANFRSSAGLIYLDNVTSYNATAFGVVDRLLVPTRHTLDGETLDLKWSHDGVNYFEAVEQWTGEAGLINKSWTSKIARYWKFIITNPTSIPELAELFLTSTYEWARNPVRPAGSFEDVFNVEHDQTASGQERFLVHGDKKRQRVYRLSHCGELQKGSIVTLNNAWSGSKPFWLEDHEGNWIYGRLRTPINLKEVAYQSYSFDFDFLEVLP